jgi:hypothetical protein
MYIQKIKSSEQEKKERKVNLKGIKSSIEMKIPAQYSRNNKKKYIYIYIF